jgi:hypothetical protein
MPEHRERLDPAYCSVKEAEFRQRATAELTAEGRDSFLKMAETWAGLAKECESRWYKMEAVMSASPAPPKVNIKPDSLEAARFLDLPSVPVVLVCAMMLSGLFGAIMILSWCH